MSAHDEEPAPLGADARRILDAGRAAERLSPRRKAQLRGRVMAAVAAGAAGAVGAAASAEAAAGAAAETASLGGAVATETAGLAGAAGAAKAAGFSLFAKIGLAVTVVTVGAGGLLWSRAHEPPPAPAALTAQTVSESAETPSGQAPSQEAAPPPSAPAEEATAVPAPSAPAPSGDPGGSAAAASQPAAPSAAPKVASTVEPAAPADSLPEETRLLAAAHAALSRGDAAAALGLLDEHAARFPRGALVPERRAARAMALCKLGRAGDGRSEADALYGADSKSPLADKIRRACAK